MYARLIENDSADQSSDELVAALPKGCVPLL